MFSADLSWTDQGTESVGERKARKAAQKQRPASAASSTSSRYFSTSSLKRSSSRNSTTALSHKISIASGISSLCCSTKTKTTAATSTHKKTASASSNGDEVWLRDPAHQADYTITGKVTTKMPSGNMLHDDHDDEKSLAESTQQEKLLHTTQLEHPKAHQQPHSMWAIPNRADADAVLHTYDRMRDAIYTIQNGEPRTFLSPETTSSGLAYSTDVGADSELDEPWHPASRGHHGRQAQQEFHPHYAQHGQYAQHGRHGSHDLHSNHAYPNYSRHFTPSPTQQKYPARRDSYEHDRQAQASFYLSPTPATDTTIHIEDYEQEKADIVVHDEPGIVESVTVNLAHHDKGHHPTGRQSSLNTVPEEPASYAPSVEDESNPVTPAHEIPPTPSGIRNGISRLPSSVSVTTPGDTSNGSLNKPYWQAPSAWDAQIEARAGSTSSSSQGRTNSSGSPDYKNANEDLESTSSEDEKPTRQQADVNHFLRFVRRMEGAGPRIILDRLKEEWEDLTDETVRDEAMMEKHLWALTALQLKALDRFARASSYAMPVLPLPALSMNKKRKMLELEGNIGEIFQASALYPNSKIAFLQRHQENYNIALPSQAMLHPDSDYKPPRRHQPSYPFVPLPYASNSMHHIRSAKLPALLPASQLMSLISECHRVLKPGGVLELRLVDPMPDRGTTGPLLLSWLEDRLLLGLEAGFRCTRPIALVPQWVQDAGFLPLPMTAVEGAAAPRGPQRKNRQSFGRLGMSRCLKLPATTEAEYVECVANASGNNAGAYGRPSAISKFAPGGERDVIVTQLASLVARALWKDCWGDFLIDPSELSDGAEDYWWWEDAGILKECREWRTVWNVGTLIVVKDQ